MSSLALNYLINLLSRRDYSEFEIRNKMQEKAFTETEIEQALATAQQKIGRMTNALPPAIYIAGHNVVTEPNA
ncbi:conserved domain protein [Haemophilus pittmaniae HK 85]|uniref:Conserved domain protein n=1 Tax=Haemophilus pittmaniae HK 85 TaxID=1035188 RepID=F9Q8G6_9PAST|nr:conserved domain protein [Haemophilus pittmaniae HK 85]